MSKSKAFFSICQNENSDSRAGWEFEFDHRCVCFHVIVVVIFIYFVLIFVFGLFHGRSIDDGRGSYQGHQGDEIFGPSL